MVSYGTRFAMMAFSNALVDSAVVVFRLIYSVVVFNFTVSSFAKGATCLVCTTLVICQTCTTQVLYSVCSTLGSWSTWVGGPSSYAWTWPTFLPPDPPPIHLPRVWESLEAASSRGDCFTIANCECPCTPAKGMLTPHSKHIMDSVSHNALSLICAIMCSCFSSPHYPLVSLPIY